METKNTHKKKTTHYKVVSAKVSPGLYEALESFRKEYGIRTRSSAINIILAYGLKGEQIPDKQTFEWFKYPKRGITVDKEES